MRAKRTTATKPLPPEAEIAGLKEQVAAYEHENASLREFKRLLLVDKSDLETELKRQKEENEKLRERIEIYELPINREYRRNLAKDADAATGAAALEREKHLRIQCDTLRDVILMAMNQFHRLER